MAIDLSRSLNPQKGLIDKRTKREVSVAPVGVLARMLVALDWLITKEAVTPSVEAIKEGFRHWSHDLAGQRKMNLFSDRLIAVTLERLISGPRLHIVLGAES
ncbi:hypothetical protein R2R70_14305 [Cobetia sp. SIMBA_158]|uniref:hypothetical protein n=1 Tax=Cobetia sp. SIMBA_158 TaxID=3081617 RepID=UPI003980C45F